MVDPEDPVPVLDPAAGVELELVLTPPVPVPLEPLVPVDPPEPAAEDPVPERQAAEAVLGWLAVDELEVEAAVLDADAPEPDVPEPVEPEVDVPDPVELEPVGPEPVEPELDVPEPVEPVALDEVVLDAVLEVVPPEPVDVAAGVVAQAAAGDPSMVSVVPMPAADDAAIIICSAAAARIFRSALSGRLTGGVSAAVIRRVTVLGESAMPALAALLGGVMIAA